MIKIPEFVANDIQVVQPNQPVVLRTALACRCGLVMHRNESGIITLRGGNRYQVTFNANIAVPEDGTVQPISVALAIDGEPILTSRAIVTPAAVDEYFNVTSTDIVVVPCGCCLNVSVENTSESVDGAPAPAINVQNSNLTVTRL